jgi:hypothetical protein
MRAVYLDRLLKAFKIKGKAARDAKSASVEWFRSDLEFDESKGVISHYAKLHKGCSRLLQPWGAFGMNRLKDVPASALVESRFSTVTLVKSKYRMAIGADKILGFILMRDEPGFDEVTFSLPVVSCSPLFLRRCRSPTCGSV